MSELNKIDCGKSRRNTGYGSCAPDMGNLFGVFFGDIDFEFTAAQMASAATFKAALQAALTADNPVERLYMAANFVQTTDNTGDVNVQEFDEGARIVTRENPYDFTHQYNKGALCVHSALRTHNGNGDVGVFYVDKFYRVYGWKKDNGNLGAVPTLIFWAPAFRPAIGANSSIYQLRISFDVDYWNDSLGFMQLDNSVRSMKGLQDIDLVSSSVAVATGVVDVTATVSCGGVNLTDLYADELGVVAAWRAENAATGGAITISSVAVVGNAFRLTLSTADADFPAVGGAVLINLAPPSVLGGLDVVGYEGIEVRAAVV